MRRLSIAKTITLGAMCAALGLLCLYAAAVLPTGRIAAYFLSSIWVYVLCAESAYIGALAVYITTSLLALILIPDRAAAVPYIVLLGHFGIFKTWFDSVMPDKVVQSAVKVLYCDVFFILGVFAAIKLLGLDIASIALPVPVWAVVLILQAVFFAYDKLYWLCQRFYDERIRPSISPRR